jgi:phosphatidylglycerol---prolipoprotein diacylglyceryl transferase
MLTYPNIDPIAFKLGPLQVHWYGIMYVIGFLAAWGLGVYRSRQTWRGWTAEQVGDLVFYAAIGVIAGGRLGYVIFYNFSFYMTHPLSVFKIWDGGMSFHGGLIGVALMLWWFGRRFDKNVWDVWDFVVPLVPLGLAAGRIGNFINGELWGRVSHVPWAMVFPHAGNLPRHPSQLYEMALEGLALFFIVWFYSSKPRARGAVTGVFCLCYGIFRFILEFYRQPDPQLGFIAFGWLTQGQLLSVPMVLVGLYLLMRKGSQHATVS